MKKAKKILLSTLLVVGALAIPASAFAQQGPTVTIDPNFNGHVIIGSGNAPTVGPGSQGAGSQRPINSGNMPNF